MRKQLILGLIFYSALFLFNSYSKADAEGDILARGKYIFDLSGCVHCHTVDKTRPLAGGYELKSQFGTFFAPNISADPKTGIGSWTEAQFLKALRNGISPKGEYYYPSFPYSNYSKLSDEDILAMRKYILSLPATEQENKNHILSFPYNQRKVLFFWRALNFRKFLEVTTPEQLYQSQGEFTPLKSRSENWNRGAYLVEGAMHCTQCHTPRNKLGGLLTKQWMSGAELFGENRPAPNLTPAEPTGLAKWKAEDWKTFLQQGVTADGDVVGGIMSRIIKVGTSKLTDKDLEAVTEYFQSLPAVENTKLVIPAE